MIPQSYIDELIARTDIVEVIDSYVSLKKAGHNFSACCPFHQEKTPSFSVSPSKQFYHCFGCGVSGNVITFLMEHERYEFLDVIKYLSERTGLPIPEDSVAKPSSDYSQLLEALQAAAKFYQQQLREHPMAETAVAYLKQRGLTGTVAKQFGIGFAPAGWDNLHKALSKKYSDKLLLQAGLLSKNDQGKIYDKFRYRIMFPIHDRRGRVVAFGGRVIDDATPKYLNSPETPVYHKSNELYGLYEARKANHRLEQIIVVEGYMDVVALAQHGITNAVATLGTATTAQHIQHLFRYSDRICICFDGDTAGHNAAWKALTIILPYLEDGREVRFLFLSEGQDPDSQVRSDGQEIFLQRLAEATSLTDYLLQQLQQQTQLDSMEGRAKFIDLAIPLLKQLPQGALQALLLSQLANLSRLDETKVAALAGLQTTATPRTQHKTSSTKKQTPSAMRLAIALLVQHPHLVFHLPENFTADTLQLAGSELLSELIDCLQQNSDLKTGALIEHWREKPYAKQLIKLASQELYIPDTGLEAEFTGALARLTEQNRQLRIEGLMAKAASAELDLSEKQELQELLKTS